MPWHRPRKQYIRREQWLQEARWVLGQRREGDEGELRYLGLPGQDLLDLRYLHNELCVPEERDLRFLGFDESANPKSPRQGSFNVSLHEVMQLPRVVDISEVRHEDFRRLGDRSSIAWQSATQHGPFDLVNLDLCDDVVKDAPALDNNLYTAIAQLFGLQRHHTSPWTFLLTTRIGGHALRGESWQRLASHLIDRIRQCSDLEPAIRTAFGSIIDNPEDLDAATGKVRFETTALGIALWMAHLATESHLSMEISNCAAYQVYGGSEYLDLVSLAFRFVPTYAAQPDRVGLAASTMQPDDGCQQDSLLPHAVAGVVDVDALLGQQHDLLDELVEEMADLLRQARYDVDQYKAWIVQGGTA